MDTRTIITKAVFPIAGLGTRFLPATKAAPKEMLPIVDKPLIQFAVEEAYAAGVREMIFVTGRNKRSVEDHFDVAYELETELLAAGKHDLLAAARSVAPDDMRCVYVRQPRALGLGHAVLCARDLIGNDAFAVLLADDLMHADGEGVTAQLVHQFALNRASVIAVQDVAREDTRRYGIVDGQTIAPGLIRLSGIVEKPEPARAPTTIGVVGRYVLTASIFDELAQQQAGAGGEIQLTDAIAALLRKEAVYAYRFAGRRFDCGSKLGFVQATVELACAHPEIGAEFAAWLAARDARPEQT
jgi:UTP--glucose-1-phosphate uridylyltransferase